MKSNSIPFACSGSAIPIGFKENLSDKYQYKIAVWVSKRKTADQCIYKFDATAKTLEYDADFLKFTSYAGHPFTTQAAYTESCLDNVSHKAIHRCEPKYADGYFYYGNIVTATVSESKVNNIVLKRPFTNIIIATDENHSGETISLAHMDSSETQSLVYKWNFDTNQYFTHIWNAEEYPNAQDCSNKTITVNGATKYVTGNFFVFPGSIGFTQHTNLTTGHFFTTAAPTLANQRIVAHPFGL